MMDAVLCAEYSVMLCFQT